MYIYPWCSILQEEESWSPKFRRECSGRWHDQTSTTPKEAQSHLCPEETALFYCRIPYHRVTSGLPNHMNPDKNTYSKTFNCNSRNPLKYASMQMQAHTFQRICLRHLHIKQQMWQNHSQSQHFLCLINYCMQNGYLDQLNLLWEELTIVLRKKIK